MYRSNLNHHQRHSFTARTSGWIAGLRRFVQPAIGSLQCGMCNAPIPSLHRHLIEPEARRLWCCCHACALLFSHQHDKYRRVPEQTLTLADFQMTEAQWDSLQIPVGMAFFFLSSTTGRVVAFYPGPAGITESRLSLEAWDRLVADNPVLLTLEPDVEALLVNRVGNLREYYRAPIDRCYELAGLLRASWRGRSGGSQVGKDLREFFARLREPSISPSQADA